MIVAKIDTVRTVVFVLSPLRVSWGDIIGLGRNFFLSSYHLL